MMKCKFLICLVLSCCFGTAAAQRGADSADRDAALDKAAAKADLKLMSFNIRYYKKGADGDNCWANRREGVLEMLRSENPDIIGFQEPHRPQVDYLKVHLSDYGWVDMGRDADTDIDRKPDGGEHLMLMYRKSRYILLDSGFFWLSETPEKASRGWDAMCRRVTVWGKFRDRKTSKEFYYFDTHFDHVGPSARRHEAEMMAAKMKEIAGDRATVFVSGDLNTTYGHDALSPLRDWMQGARETAPLTDDLPSFNDWGARNLWIDHIFYRRAKILGYKTVMNSEQKYGVPYLSDHNPVFALFKL